MNKRASYRRLAVLLLVTAITGFSLGFALGIIPVLLQVLAARIF